VRGAQPCHIDLLSLPAMVRVACRLPCFTLVQRALNALCTGGYQPDTAASLLSVHVWRTTDAASARCMATV
jgi:hypothetical protein